ncbi:MAG: hypothetical protein KIT31_14860 [Deltaproteobacteria bacterium]|nr:hypothetical protein [Deltaproteobacteria bacterium]
MPTLEMAESSSAGADDTADAAPGAAPRARDAIDPELIKLRRTRPKIGIVTALGLVGLSAYFIFKLAPDRSYAGEPEKAPAVALAEVAAGRVDTNRHIRVEAEPVVAHAIRASLNKNDIGMRVAPARGTGDKVWIAVDGDGWIAPAVQGYDGRLRRLKDVPFGATVAEYAAEHPRIVFATVAELRVAVASNKLKTVSGDVVDVRDTDRLAIDQVDPNASTIVASFNDRLPDVATWKGMLKAAEIIPQRTGEPDLQLRNVKFDVSLPVAEVTRRLEKAELWAARVDSVPHHFEATIADLRGSGPQALNLKLSAPGAAPQVVAVPDTDLDLVGVYVMRPIPDDALVLIAGEAPGDYWYVMPITLALLAIGLVFAWALVRAVRRDLIPPART